MKFNTISIFNRFLQKSHVFPKKNMTHDFRWVMKIVRGSRFDLFLWNAKKIRLLSINMTPSGWSVWFFPFFAFFSKTTIFWYRNILYDSSLFSKLHLVLEGQKKVVKKVTLQITSAIIESSSWLKNGKFCLMQQNYLVHLHQIYLNIQQTMLWRHFIKYLDILLD